MTQDLRIKSWQFNKAGPARGGPPVYLFSELAGFLNMEFNDFLNLRNTYNTKIPFPEPCSVNGPISRPIKRWSLAVVKPWLKAVKADLRVQVLARQEELAHRPEL